MDHGQEHLTEQQAEQFRRRRMARDEKAFWERHLAGCHRCLERVFGRENASLISERLVEALAPPAEEEFHLSLAELQRYAGGALDEADRTILESHLEDCSACRRAAEALANAKPVAVSPEPEWLRFWHRPALAWAATVAVALVLVLGWRLWHGANSGGEQVSQKSGIDTEVIVRLVDGGHEITLDKHGTLAGLEALDPAAKNAVQEVLTNAELAKPQVLSELSSPAIRLMGPTDSTRTFALISPSGTVVADEQPTLRWEALSGATDYTVEVFDSQFRKVARSSAQQKTEWRVLAPLHRGATYFWQVTASKGAQQITVPSAPAPKAEFKVLDSQTVDDLQKARNLAPSSHLALGILYARAGMRLDAERELEALVRENQQSPLAAKLLNDVRAWGHQNPSPTTTKPAQ